MKRITSIIVLLFSLTTCYSQTRVFAIVGGGVNDLFPSVELQVGLRNDNFIYSIGYIAVKDDGKPILINVRTGYIIDYNADNKFIVYTGAVNSRRSLEMKKLNYYTWQVGGTYAFCFFSFGSFYLSSTYTHKEGVSGILGMTVNIFRTDN